MPSLRLLNLGVLLFAFSAAACPKLAGLIRGPSDLETARSASDFFPSDFLAELAAPKFRIAKASPLVHEESDLTFHRQIVSLTSGANLVFRLNVAWLVPFHGLYLLDDLRFQDARTGNAVPERVAKHVYDALAAWLRTGGGSSIRLTSAEDYLAYRRYLEWTDLRPRAGGFGEAYSQHLENIYAVAQQDALANGEAEYSREEFSRHLGGSESGRKNQNELERLQKRTAWPNVGRWLFHRGEAVGLVYRYRDQRRLLPLNGTQAAPRAIDWADWADSGKLALEMDLTPLKAEEVE